MWVEFVVDCQQARARAVGDGAHAQPSAAQIGDPDAIVLKQVARADLTHCKWIQRRNPTTTPMRYVL